MIQKCSAVQCVARIKVFHRGRGGCYRALEETTDSHKATAANLIININGNNGSLEVEGTATKF